MFQYLRLLPKYPDNANKGTKRLYLFLSYFLFVFILSAISGLQIITMIFGPNIASLVSNTTLPSFFLMAIAAFVQRNTLRKTPHIEAYKAMTTMIKHQFAGLFVVLVLFSFYFDSAINSIAQDVTTNQGVDIPVFYLAGTVLGMLVYLYGFFGIIRACWKYRKNITNEEKLTQVK
jgi:hypothetical protein